MFNVYDISTGTGDYQIHSVVAKNMAEAERIFRGKYWPTTIKAITIHSEYVLVQDMDEQPRDALLAELNKEAGE